MKTVCFLYYHFQIISKSSAKLKVAEVRSYREQDIVEDYGYPEPDSTPPGKCTIKQVVQFTSDFKEDPRTNNLEKLASQYKLDPDELRNVLVHFQTLLVHVPTPEEPETKAVASRKLLKKMIKGPDSWWLLWH